MEYKIVESTKSGINTEESFLIVKGNESFLRIIGQNPHYMLMTATANEDNGEYSVCMDTNILLESFQTLAEEININIAYHYDIKKRPYISITFKDKKYFLENGDTIISKFFEIYNKLLSSKEMKELYDELSVFNDGRDVYLSDGVYLRKDGSLYE
ncbi:hypothetical protein FBY51_0247 [Zymomonas mobilis]|uniref:hypothetical protein n=1 Tax=Zymomonas mobilis TaxID=542 RepID=UPI00026D8297|nr:hypothetical protein [Zymomonas mobilis]AFN56481.1 hypothetical protein ZZ6_0583 [Zymomonas mobilis subsp. mobilis ATCC 29191]TQK78088.1 hypothetical protein FBY53_0741 [Zymomonas mobilis]TQL15266.1 hypothetical protein FBY51_0247 [Zymomonas mobilis]GEB86661.1 hypothetical protein ZMO01_00010 [Zymomonas mobilis subsp. mobilis]